MAEVPPDTRDIPKWDVTILTLQNGNSKDLHWGRRYKVLSGKGTVQTGYKASNDPDGEVELKRDLTTFTSMQGIFRDLTPMNANQVVRVTSTCEVLGIISEPFVTQNR